MNDGPSSAGLDSAKAPASSTRSMEASWSVLGSGALALILGSAAISLVREELHISCSMGPPGSEGADTWTCSDGIGYIGVAVVLGAMWLAVGTIGALVALLVAHDRVARPILTLLAATSAAWILGWTWYGSNELVQAEYAPMTGPHYWTHVVGPAAIASALGVAAGLLSLVLPARPSRVLGLAAPVGLIIATVLQPGLSLNMLPAAGLLAAATLRGTR